MEAKPLRVRSPPTSSQNPLQLVLRQPIRGDDGQVEAIAGTTRDVTERKETEDELHRANESLEQFAYSASHDLQEPLRTISIYSQLLDSRYRARLDGSALQYLDFVRSGALRIEMLVHDLLAYTQVTRLDAPASPTDASLVLA
jgi:light-regulated signal transduction histidine kinase (bacteriophytochrome)